MPTPLQILCHNLLQTQLSQPAVIDFNILTASPQTTEFFSHILSSLFQNLTLTPPAQDQLEPFVHDFSPDLLDVMMICRRLAYSPHTITGLRDNLHKNLPYDHYDLATLLLYVGRSVFTLQHFTSVITPNRLTPTLALTTIRSYFNQRFGTAVFAVLNAPMPDGTIQVINRQLLEAELQHAQSDVEM